MQFLLRRLAILAVFFVCCAAWLVLGAITLDRSGKQSERLEGSVADLWGHPQTQKAPGFTAKWETVRDTTRTEVVSGQSRVIHEQVREAHEQAVSTEATELKVHVGLDQRLKGLVWYSLYNLTFDGRWTYVHRGQPGTLRIDFRFPDPNGIYDGFVWQVDDKERASGLRPQEGRLLDEIQVVPGQTVRLHIAYKTRGMNEWRYQPGEGVTQVENFRLNMTTDFEEIDFPAYGMSPSQKVRSGNGWVMDWNFERLITGNNFGLVTPNKIQPGELAAELSFSAPISLFFFFLILQVLSLLRGLEIHPINYLFLAGAFFAFHLLFAYTVDHLPLMWAFILASGVSILLVTTYLRLVVSSTFAFREAALAQGLYLIVFSLAHFLPGFTGLTVTVLSILTLFVLMQLTGRIRWTEVLQTASKPPVAPPSSLAGLMEPKGLS